MFLIVSLTGTGGFLASFILHKLGLDVLWIRYLAAVAAAYGFFLFLLWCWLRLRLDAVPDVPDSPSAHAPDASNASCTVEPKNVELPWEPGGGRYGGGGASGSFDDGVAPALSAPNDAPTATVDAVPSVDIGLSDIGDAADAVPALLILAVIAAIAALTGAAIASIWIVGNAPAFLAEILVDAALAAGLYRKLQWARGDFWLTTAIRRTIWPFCAVALLFTASGAFVHGYAPSARTLGEAIQHYKETHARK